MLHALLVGVANESVQLMSTAPLEPSTVKAAGTGASDAAAVAAAQGPEGGLPQGVRPELQPTPSVHTASMPASRKPLFCAACRALPVTSAALEVLGLAPPPPVTAALAAGATAGTGSSAAGGAGGAQGAAAPPTVAGGAAAGGTAAGGWAEDASGWVGLVRLFASVAAAAGAGGDGELRAEAAIALGEVASSQVRHSCSTIVVQWYSLFGGTPGLQSFQGLRGLRAEAAAALGEVASSQQNGLLLRRES